MRNSYIFAGLMYLLSLGFAYTGRILWLYKSWMFWLFVVLTVLAIGIAEGSMNKPEK